MTFDARYYRARVERLLERRSKKAALRSDMMRRVQRQKLAAGAAKLPTDLEKLSQHLGIREIRCVPLSMNGRLFRSDRGLVIEVNERLDDFRGRQTIAHELAHLILEGDALWTGASTLERHTSTGASAVEELCDLGAEEILAPEALLRQRLLGSKPSFEEAENIARDSNCDVEWIIGRAIKLQLWKARLVLFEPQLDSFNAVQTIPEVDRAFLASIRPSADGNRLLQRAILSGSKLQCDLGLTTADGECSYSAELRPYSQMGVSALLRYQ